MALSLNSQVGETSHDGSVMTSVLPTITSGDIVVICFSTNGGPATSVTSANLTFSFRARNQTAGSQFTEEVWYAVAGSNLTNEVITVHPTTAGQFFSSVSFSVSGANTSTPFDTNGALPYTLSSAGNDVFVSTSNANTFIFAAYRAGSVGVPTNGAGFTQLGFYNVDTVFHLVEYKIVSSTQSSLDCVIGTGSGDMNGGIGDAIQMAGAASGPVGRNIFLKQAIKRASIY